MANKVGDLVKFRPNFSFAKFCPIQYATYTMQVYINLHSNDSVQYTVGRMTLDFNDFGFLIIGFASTTVKGGSTEHYGMTPLVVWCIRFMAPYHC